MQARGAGGGIAASRLCRWLRRGSTGFLVLAASTVGGAGCAKMGPPTGGPVDRTPPRVVSHMPAADARQVPLDAPVELIFSEPMDEQATCGAVFVAPAVEVKKKCRGRVLRMRMDLKAGRTYVVTVGTDARDRHGNRLQHSYSLAFATGAQLDQGRIAGAVYRTHTPAAGATVWAYDLAYAGETGRDPPQYRTQTGMAGTYAFERLAPGRYRIMAFADANRDRRVEPDEWVALPAKDLRVAQGDTARAGDLLLVPPAREISLQRIRAVDRRRLALLFSEPVGADDVLLEFEGLPVERLYSVPGDSHRVYARTAVQDPMRKYAVRRLVVHGREIPWRQRVHGSGNVDHTPPRVVMQRPSEEAIGPLDSLSLGFSEPMERRVPADLWTPADSTNRLPVGRWEWLSPTVLCFVPQDALGGEEGGMLVARVHLEQLRDLAGLAPADSVLQIRYRVLARRDLVTVEGRTRGQRGPVWVIAQGRSRTYRTRADSAGAFLLKGMLPGTYRLYAFADANEDGSRFPGRLVPFQFAEPYCCWPREVTLKEGDRADLGSCALR